MILAAVALIEVEDADVGIGFRIVGTELEHAFFLRNRVVESAVRVIEQSERVVAVPIFRAQRWRNCRAPYKAIRYWCRADISGGMLRTRWRSRRRISGPARWRFSGG